MSSMTEDLEARGVKPLTVDEQKMIVAMINMKIDKLVGENEPGAWFQVFKAFDNDASGMIEFEELEAGLRKKLKIKKEEISEDALKGLWVAIDDDDSGYVEQSEFQKFMGRESSIQKRQLIMQQKSKTQRQLVEKRQKDEIAAEKFVSSQSTDEMKEELEAEGSIGVPDELGTMELSCKFAMWVKRYMPDAHQGIAWLKVFKEVDSDNSGLLTYDELRLVIRRKFKVPAKEFSELQIKQIWVVVDADGSDKINQAEFGRFVKLAGTIKEGDGRARFSWTNRVMAVRAGSLDVEAAKKLSKLMNEKVDAAMEGNSGDWFDLFRTFDGDCSGLLTKDELEQGIREKLSMGMDELSAKTFNALWITLDEDDSGYIEQAEFMRFMEREEPKNAIERRQELMRQSSKQKRAQMEKEAQTWKEDQKMISSKSTAEMKQELKAKNVPIPDDLGKKEYAIKFAMWVKRYMPDAHQGVAWLKVFKEVDGDGSGVLTYDELRLVIRRKFKVPAKEFSEVKIMSMWCMLDSDDSDSLSTAEFGRFIKLAGHIKSGDGRQSFSSRDQPLEARKGGLDLEETKIISALLNDRVNKIMEGKGDDWFSLFKEFDNDSSGLLEFNELKHAIRTQLMIEEGEISNLKLRQMWISLDEDDSGYVEQAEFARFMDRDEPKTRDEERRELLRQSSKQKRAMLEKEGSKYIEDEKLTSTIATQEMRDELATKNFPIPEGEDLKNLAIQFAKWVKIYLPDVHHGIAWLTILKEVDDDHSGVLTYDSVRHVIRRIFKVKKAVWSEEQIKAIWCALDAENENAISRVEFGKFVKMAGKVGSDTRQFVMTEKLWEARKGGLTEEDAKAVAKRMNKRIDELMPGENWYDLFKAIDEDASGMLSEEELKAGIREQMKMGPDELSDAKLKALWITLDEDDSGYVESAELHRFLERKEPKTNIEKRQELMRQSSKRKRAALEKAGEVHALDEKLKSSVKTSVMRADLKEKGLEPFGEREILTLSKEWGNWCRELKPDSHQANAWLVVFKEIDNDDTGVLTYDELRIVIRRSFKLPNSQFSEDKIKQLWCALDQDNSDAITTIEFGRFMKVGQGKLAKFFVEQKDDFASRMARGLSSIDPSKIKIGPKKALPPPIPVKKFIQPTPVIPRIRPNTVPAKDKWSKPKTWNAMRWAPTSAETNFLGGPWSMKGSPFAATISQSPARVLPSPGASPRTTSPTRR